MDGSDEKGEDGCARYTVLCEQQGSADRGDKDVFDPLGGLARPLREPRYNLSVGNRYMNPVWTPLTLGPCGPQVSRCSAAGRRRSGSDAREFCYYSPCTLFCMDNPIWATVAVPNDSAPSSVRRAASG
jgi:hypothetical protein